MSDATAPLTLPPDGDEGRAFPSAVYGLYFLGLAYGITIPIGLAVAYAKRRRAGPRMRSHYEFQIRTVWLALGWVAAGGVLMLVGLPLSVLIIGVPIVQLGLAIWGLSYVWLLARCLSGGFHLAQNSAYPRPRSWLI